MNWRGGLKTSQGIFWFAAAGVLGWPFAAALCAPFMFEELLLLIFGDKTAIWEGFVRIGRGVVSAMLLLVSLGSISLQKLSNIFRLATTS